MNRIAGIIIPKQNLFMKQIVLWLPLCLLFAACSKQITETPAPRAKQADAPAPPKKLFPGLGIKSVEFKDSGTAELYIPATHVRLSARELSNGEWAIRIGGKWQTVAVVSGTLKFVSSEHISDLTDSDYIVKAPDLGDGNNLGCTETFCDPTRLFILIAHIPLLDHSDYTAPGDPIIEREKKCPGTFFSGGIDCAMDAAAMDCGDSQLTSSGSFTEVEIHGSTWVVITYSCTGDN